MQTMPVSSCIEIDIFIYLIRPVATRALLMKSQLCDAISKHAMQYVNITFLFDF